jgi:hypothetical protein
MPSSTRRFKCRCSKCFNKYSHLDAITRSYYRLQWEDILVVSWDNEYVTLKCRNCSHIWKSKSKAAWRKAID